MELITEVLPRRPKPVTATKDHENWAFNAAHLESIWILFGSRIGEAIESSSVRKGEKANSPTLKTTESVRVKVPRTNRLDGIMWLDIGFADIFARTLFPQHLADLHPYNPLEGHTVAQPPAVPGAPEASASDGGK